MLTQCSNVMLSKVEASPFSAFLRSFTFVQDDKFKQKNETWVNCYIVTNNGI